MTINELEDKITRDLAVELADEFDRNFERKAYFNQAWPQAKISNHRGTLMMRSGNLRRSIRYNVNSNTILFSSSLPYASIHNNGGNLVVTDKMKRFFWAMYYKAIGGAGAAKGQKKVSLTGEAAQWKNLALMKIGHIMKIPKRQFIGNSPEVARIVKGVIDENMIAYNQELVNKYRR